MKRAKWNKSLTFIIFLLLYVMNNGVHANGNELKGTDGVDVPNQQDTTNDYNTSEGISNQGQSATSNHNNPASHSDTQKAEEGSDAKQGNTFLDEKNIVQNVETYFIPEGQNKVYHTDMGTVKEGTGMMGHVQRNAHLRTTSHSPSQGAVKQGCNSVQGNPFTLNKNGANVKHVAKAQDDLVQTQNVDVGNGTEEKTDENAKEQTVEKTQENTEQKTDGDKQTEIPSTGEQIAEDSDHAQKIKNRLLKEGRELKETTSMIDNAVYNVEQLIIKTKFYATAIRNFVHFKVNHVCEYSKCGPNARCYILEKDKEQCRCLANYMPDESVDYFKCIPKTVKECSKDNGNCDVNAACSIDKNTNIKCQCKHNYIGDGIFCVMGSQENQSLCLLILLLICFLHKFLF
ncbi:hypothetical protein AK88_02227 [Plasmodium fragile]|uniref:EGF-like domain-containing protein n=1 Tax=Plasmodium fragile TaxID=5857 RepID=A0A0D9QMH3_PLAFR|nr:uncharacterized protein AK88_02227 [Plasmodium fragile]KJP88113.1 hypothetical protein AK88_02227 [Plasmodium fragile]